MGTSGNKENIPFEEDNKKRTKEIPLSTINNFSKSMCKIRFEDKKKNFIGFFLNFKKEKNLYCLITNYYNITEESVKKKLTILIEIENHSEEAIVLDNKKRLIKCIKNPICATVIEILDSDLIKNEIEFLSYDFNSTNGYNEFLNEDIFVLQKNLEYSMGKIIDVMDYEFQYTIGVQYCDFGSPIILVRNSKVIGFFNFNSHCWSFYNCFCFSNLNCCISLFDSVVLIR